MNDHLMQSDNACQIFTITPVKRIMPMKRIVKNPHTIEDWKNCIHIPSLTSNLVMHNALLTEVIRHEN